MAGGAAVTVLTKSGTNEFHGSAFALHENEGLARAQLLQLRREDRQLAATSTAPPWAGRSSRTSCSSSWAGRGRTRQTHEHAHGHRADGGHAGAATSARSGTTIYDPATGNPDGTGRTPFPGNRHPGRPDQLDRARPAEPAAPAQPARRTSGNYTGTGPIDLTATTSTSSSTTTSAPAAQIWAKYSQMNATVESDMWLGNPAGRRGGRLRLWRRARASATPRSSSGTLGTTWTLSPNLVLDGTIGMTRFDQECIPPDVGTNFGTDVLGIPGTNGDGLSGGDPRRRACPASSITGYERLRRRRRLEPALPQRPELQRLHQPHLGHGQARHALRRRRRQDGAEPLAARARAAGREAASTSTAARPPSGRPARPTSSTPTPSSCSGSPPRRQKSVQYETLTGREWQYGFYFRDRWQVTQEPDPQPRACAARSTRS